MDALSVSQLNTIVREALNLVLPEEIWVEGEISGFRLHAKSGHCYFDLVEKGAAEQYLAKVPCAFFKGSLLSCRARLAREGVKFELHEGLSLRLRARADFYAREGRFQLIVSEIDPSFTLGALARQRLATVEKLKNAGLFELNHGRTLTRIPLNVGLITSLGSAAYNDFVSVLSGSGYAFSLKAFDAHMQGDATVAALERGLRLLGSQVDAIVICRGGGAKTDLVWFDDYRIAEAVARCPVPVITGIGHEIDLSVTDLVAWRHLVTPTDTARFLVSRLDAVGQSLNAAETNLRAVPLAQVSAARRELERQAGILSARAQNLNLNARLSLKTVAANLGGAAVSLNQGEARRLIRLSAELGEAARRQLTAAGHRLAGLEQKLELLDPAASFARGYSITLGPDGRPLTSVDQAAPGDKLTTVLSDGQLHSTLTERTKP